MNEITNAKLINEKKPIKKPGNEVKNKKYNTGEKC